MIDLCVNLIKRTENKTKNAQKQNMEEKAECPKKLSIKQMTLWLR